MDEFENKNYKTKDYVRRALNKYRNKKYNENEEFKQKTLEGCKKNYIKNKDNEEYKTKRKLYMREYRAKKKAEKQLEQQPTPGNGESARDNSDNVADSNAVEKKNLIKAV
jgi:hypothetical protein